MLDVFPSSICDLSLKLRGCTTRIAASLFVGLPHLKRLEIFLSAPNFAGDPREQDKFEVDKPLYKLETLVVWLAVTNFPACTDGSLQEYLPKLTNVSIQVQPDKAQSVLDLGASADLQFARFFLTREIEAIPTDSEDLDDGNSLHGGSPYGDASMQIYVLETSKLHVLHMLGPQKGCIL